jgi:pimeloyl-ACP methyl ester carboxylesterase
MNPGHHGRNGDPGRRALWGFRLASRGEGNGAEVRALDPGSAAHRAGLRAGDRVLTINGRRLDGQRSISEALRACRGGEAARLEVEREGHRSTVAFSPPPLPFEKIDGCEVRYGWVESPRGYRVRTVLTRPANVRGNVPVIVFVPWLSCDPVEAPPGNPDGWIRLLHGLAERSGWALLRVEKPGVGDSEGPDCGEHDLETDLDAFRAALSTVGTLEGIDVTRLVLFGGSIGGALAPVLAAEHRVAGLIVAGGFTRTWFEHMLEIERARLSLGGASPAAVNRALRAFSEFYDLYLNQRLTPGEVMARRPDLASHWYDAPDGQYGRPAAYHHQVARLDVEEAWAKVEVPVLVLHGEYDWIMSRAEAERAAEIVNGRVAGRADLVILPRTDHNFGVYETRQDAFDDRNGRFDPAVVDRVVAWLTTRFPETRR